jgi:hypothetical protein
MVGWLALRINFIYYTRNEAESSQNVIAIKDDNQMLNQRVEELKT